MSFLLDTHALLWLYAAPERLSSKAKEIIKNPENTLFISTVSAWEIQIKVQSGKLELAEKLSSIIQEQQAKNGMQILPVILSHIYALEFLPLHHKDPFDRLLIAQAQSDKLNLLTKDSKLESYNVALYW